MGMFLGLLAAFALPVVVLLWVVIDRECYRIERAVYDELKRRAELCKAESPANNAGSLQ